MTAILGVVQLRAMNAHTEENFPATAIVETQQPAVTHSPLPSPAIPSSSPQEPETASQTVYITPSGKKYHVADCRHVKGSDLTELSVDEAVVLGKEPCKDCIK